MNDSIADRLDEKSRTWSGAARNLAAIYASLSKRAADGSRRRLERSFDDIIRRLDAADEATLFGAAVLARHESGAGALALVLGMDGTSAGIWSLLSEREQLAAVVRATAFEDFLERWREGALRREATTVVPLDAGDDAGLRVQFVGAGLAARGGRSHPQEVEVRDGRGRAASILVRDLGQEIGLTHMDGDPVWVFYDAQAVPEEAIQTTWRPSGAPMTDWLASILTLSRPRSPR